MDGPEGRKMFQASVLKILKHAGLVITKSEQDLPKGWKMRENQHIQPGSKSNASQKHREYNPMEMFRERLKSKNQSHHDFQEDGDIPSGKQTYRESVIKSPRLQDSYAIPVFNSFDALRQHGTNLGN